MTTVSVEDEGDFLTNGDFWGWDALGLNGVKAGDLLGAKGGLDDRRRLDVGVEIDRGFLRSVLKTERGGDLVGSFGVISICVEVELGVKAGV